MPRIAGPISGGPREWGMTQDDEGFREYFLVYRVECGSGEGPAAASNCPGLPGIGYPWLVEGDVDIWVFRKLRGEVTQVEQPGRQSTTDVKYFDVKLFFSNKSDQKSCKDQRIDDPLLEPQKISGSFTNVKREESQALRVRYYDSANELVRTTTYPKAKILNSAHEYIRGPQNEWDHSIGKVRVEQNVPILGADTFEAMRNTVNTAPLWNFPSRCVKLGEIDWERKFYGSCNAYYTRTFNFDIDVYKDPDTGVIVSGHDRWIDDEGTKCVKGEWNAAGTEWVTFVGGGRTNPANFARFHDQQGHLTRVLLDGNGAPWNPDVAGDRPGRVRVERALESNFLLLGIPTTL